ncbi:SEL1-like repeat protein [Pseudomonas sp. B21-015]|uniref:tetratricopeptide repeat protein n=1 Tax=Pseudomonas sp. B21-015 TaxID=2895473 RepID=UPI00215ED5F0|nr:SEL1-like repeat protein [Pseudomonas sp. B21-015]UVM50338.1 SEL1-like repeat protein [Pseudomonas sp. B21-015]
MSKYLSTLEIDSPTERLQAHSIREAAVLYVYLLATKCKLPAGGISKIVLQQAPVEAEKTLLDVCTYSHPFKHLDKLPANATDSAIRQSLIEDINDALLSLAALKGWDTDPIHKLQAEIIKRDYRFSGTSGRSLKNPSKTLTATAAWRTDQYINIGVLVQGSKNTPEAFFTATRISVALGLFESLLGPVEWVDDQTVRLFQVNKRDYWEIDTTSQTVEFHFPRAESGDAHGQYDLAKMYIDGWIVEQDFEQARRWLERSVAQGFSRAVKLLQRMNDGDENLADPVMNSKK